MAIVAPGWTYAQLPGKSRVALQPRIINLHTMAGTFAGSKAYFTPSGRPYSHFGLNGGGYGEQWQDLAYRAASDLDGNPYSISIETEDKGSFFPAWSGSDVPKWTPAQVEQLVVLMAWLCVRFGIPPVLLTDSLPGRRGGSYHRLGIDPWRVSGGIRYSSARGKVCPGDRRIAQLASVIIPRVAQLVHGTTPPPPPPPPPVQIPMEADLMPYPTIAVSDGAAADPNLRRPWAVLKPGQVLWLSDAPLTPLPRYDEPAAATAPEAWMPSQPWWDGLYAGLYLPVRKLDTTLDGPLTPVGSTQLFDRVITSVRGSFATTFPTADLPR